MTTTELLALRLGAGSVQDHLDQPVPVLVDGRYLMTPHWTQLIAGHGYGGLARHLASGGTLPPVLVSVDQLLDGRHRVLAARQLHLPGLWATDREELPE